MRHALSGSANPENDTDQKRWRHGWNLLDSVNSLGVLLKADSFESDRPWNEPLCFHFSFLPRKEVIQPHLPIRLPCYDFTPVIDLTFGGWLLAVTSPTSGAINSHGVTGGVYKARERIHRGMLIRDY